MMIKLRVLLAGLLCSILICSCDNPQANFESTVFEDASTKESYDATFDDNSLKDGTADSSILAEQFFSDGLYSNGIPATLYYKLIEGEQIAAFGEEGKAWAGTFQYSLELQDEEKTIIKSYETLDTCFRPYTQINFADYNSDGLLDFTLCEQESTQPICKIMTIYPDGTIDCVGEVEFYCVCPYNYGSPLFELCPDGNGFYIDYHHPTSEMAWLLKDEIDIFFETCDEYEIYGAYLAYVREEYQWQDNKFVLVDHKLMPCDETDKVFMEVFNTYLERINRNSGH